jgi:glycosyltransferase involved in cell wall biosynthesis
MAKGTSTWKEDAALLEDEGLKKCVEFTGILTGEQIASLYQSADLFVYPSLIEAFGFPVIEAMAAGVPIVAADAPINRELCGDAALYFDAFDPLDCAEKISRALQDEDLRKALSISGIQRSKQFTWNAHIKRLLAGFHELLS